MWLRLLVIMIALQLQPIEFLKRGGEKEWLRFVAWASQCGQTTGEIGECSLVIKPSSQSELLLFWECLQSLLLAFQVALVFRLSLLSSTYDDIPIHMRRWPHKEFLATIDPIIQTEFEMQSKQITKFLSESSKLSIKDYGECKHRVSGAFIWKCFSRDHFLRTLEIFSLKSPNIGHN